MTKITKYVERLSSLLFGLVIIVFFAIKYNYHLHYQEQLQMFLFTTDYFSNLASCPGGIADYLGTFFVQFYYFSWLGALIIATLLVLLQQQICFFSYKFKPSSPFYPLTFVPSVLFWALLCDENFMLTALIAVIITLAFVQVYIALKIPIIRIISFVIILASLYWIVGGVFWVFGVFCMTLEMLVFRKLTKWEWAILIISFLLIVTISPFVAKNFLQYPLSRLWWGLSYYRYPIVSPLFLLIAWLTLVLILSIIRFLPSDASKSKFLFVLSIQIILLSCLSVWLIRLSVDSKKEEIMAYDYNIRIQNWSKVIDMANHKVPNNPLSVACLNLALCKGGKMGDNMFCFFQNGTEGLLPSFQRDFTISLIGGEIYYHLGLLNTSMQYSFEAMEAIPDFKKSSRTFKRLAEINLLNGEYEVATKYLHVLQNTLFYREWATKTLKCVGNEKLIDQNPEWALLRKYRLKEDFLFSDQDKGLLLYTLFTHCPSNRMAYEYLMAYTLLSKDLDRFLKYFPLGKNLEYPEIPQHYQEALILMWATKTKNLDYTPWPIKLGIKQNMSKYAQIYTSVQNSEPLLRAEFSQTYWYYLHFRN